MQRDFRSYAELMGKVGSCLYCWSTLEQELSAGILEAQRRLEGPSTKVRGTFANRLGKWFELVIQLPENIENVQLATEVRDQALALKQIRNIVVHGLQGGNSYPDEGEGHIRCAIGGYDAPTGEIVLYTFSQLDDFAQGADACKRAFMSLQHFNYRITLF